MAVRIYRSRLTAQQPSARLYRAQLQVPAGGATRLYRARLGAPGEVIPPAPQATMAGAQVQLVATAPPGATSWEWEQVSGPAVTLTGSDGTRQFTAPYLLATQTVTLRVRATVAGSPTPWAETTVQVAKHPIWVKRGGEWRAVGRATPPPPAEDATPGLWFKVPDTIREHTKKVFFHYFGPYPRSLDNAASETTTGYHTAFNNPRYSTYAEFGGMYRDRPLFRAPIGGDYVLADALWDIEQAVAAGIDGFFPDLLGLSGANYDRYEKLRQAAINWNAAHPTAEPFYIAPMVDANGATGAATAQTAAAYVKRFCIGTGSAGATPLSSAFFLPNGKYLVSAFRAEGKPASYWQQLLGYLQTDWGIDAAFMPCYNNFNSSASYTTVPQYGSGPWGYGADPSVINAAANLATTARARGEVFMAPIAAHDQRPPFSLFDESVNTGSLRAAWEKAIGQNAEYAQGVTWSDFSETPMAPSVASGWCHLDISAWYITRWKTGAYPAILRDGIILSHRARTLGATITGGPQTTFMQHWPRGNRSALGNKIEILTFLTAAATVNVTIGSTSYSYTAPAGMNVRTYDVPGAVPANAISAQVVRGSTITTQVVSPVAIRSTAINDDYQYFRFSSIRGTAGQYDPSTLY